MRALLIVNPRATSTTRLRRDVIASALASAVQLDVVETRYRGHATKLAGMASAEGCELVLTLGGDGTVNEAVNGMLHHQDGLSADELPALAALPGGSANVFAGALGLPRDPIDAVGQVLQALAEGRERLISLGMAGDRYFTFNSGLGLDAEVVRAVQGWRALGGVASPSLYVRLALRQFYQQTDRREPAVRIDMEDGKPLGPVFVALISNTSPWTYLGSREITACPLAGFDTGLDMLALRRLSSVRTMYAIAQMLVSKNGPGPGRNVISLHDQPAITLRAVRPVAFQIDGEYVGELESVTFRSIPKALRVVT